MRCLVVGAGLAAQLCSAGAARAQAPENEGAEAPSAPKESELSDQAELARVVSLYKAGRYAECADEFGSLLDGKGPRPFKEPRVKERARIFHAACLIGSGKPDLASAPIEAALDANLQMEPPDSLVFPLPVVELFFKVRETRRDAIRKSEDDKIKKARALAAAQGQKTKAELARIRGLEQLAAQETVVTKNRRWLAMVPFGVGQFQNGDTGLGWVFFAAEGLLAGGALTALTVRTFIQADLAKAPEPDEVDVNARLQGWQTTLEVSAWGLIGVAALGILEAQLSFEPEFREIRKRDLPKHLRPSKAAAIAPLGVVTRDGFTLGFHGKF